MRSLQAGTRRGIACVAALVVAGVCALAFAGTARAATTIAIHNTAELENAFKGAGCVPFPAPDARPCPVAGDTLLLDAGNYSPSLWLEIALNNLKVIGSSSGSGVVISGSNITSASPTTGTIDVFVVKTGVTTTIQNLAVTSGDTSAAAVNLV